jgi:hypothetical protein
MLGNTVKQKLAKMSRDLYTNNTKRQHVLYCSNGIYKIEVDPPKPNFRGDRYCNLVWYEYNKETKSFELCSSYGSPFPQDLSFEILDRFNIF